LPSDWAAASTFAGKERTLDGVLRPNGAGSKQQATRSVHLDHSSLRTGHEVNLTVALDILVTVRPVST